MRRPHRAQAQRKKGPRANSDIDVEEVQLIDADGDNKGIVAIADAIDLAKDHGLDLVEISPNNKPPICKILDLGKYKYEAQKKAAEARKKQKTQDVKEIKMRPNIDTHDYDVKMRSISKFIGEGDKVKVTLRFRGREMAHQELGMQLLQKVKEDTDKIAKVDAEPKLEGRQMMMVISPAK
ncbi:MAG: translation initiation factor IF-3 [Hyphomicrobiales bacterium]|nr:translation initiation factor IF-3 [Hyphomicrobiales bacterium]